MNNENNSLTDMDTNFEQPSFHTTKDNLDSVISKSKRTNRMTIYQLTVTAVFTALIIVGAFIKIPFPVVPITLQTLFVLMAGMLIGSRYSAVSVGLYLFLGLVGLPVFTKGGGPGYVFQPTFGFLIGFLIAAIVIGMVVKKTDAKSIFSLWSIGLLGIFIIYLVGMIYLYLILNYYVKSPVAFWSLFSVNIMMTIVGDLFKCLVAAILTVRLRKILGKSKLLQDF
jgi:biotin transport system substrate-specific component